MRKILLATTAIVGFAVAGAAQAANAPLNVTVGGSVDFVAGAFHESKAAVGAGQTNDEFETLYSLNFGVSGKAGSVEYGGTLVLDNAPDIADSFAGNNNGLVVTAANVFMSGAFGKVVLGDSRGATELALAAPVVGAGQVTGRYIDFLDTAAFAKNFVVGVDGVDHSTNVTYFTPKVGNEMHKVQAAVSFVPQFYNYGSNVTLTDGSNTNSPYSNVVKGAVAYTGAFKPVTVGLSVDVVTGSSKNDASTVWMGSAGAAQDFTTWGVAAQAAADGFTLGGTYTDMGDYNTFAAQSKDQQTYSVALKYEFNKVGVGVSYLGGEGYSNTLTHTGTGVNDQYVKDFNAYGVGGTYAWAPGLTTNVDGVMFDQKTESSVKNSGYVLLVSQKLAF